MPKRLTGKQRRALREVIAFAPDSLYPTSQAVAWFFARSDRGVTPAWENSKHYRDYTSLLMAHHMMSGAQETMWIEGMEDYPLGLVLQDYVARGMINPGWWERKLPAYRRLLDLYNRCTPFMWDVWTEEEDLTMRRAQQEVFLQQAEVAGA